MTNQGPRSYVKEGLHYYLEQGLMVFTEQYLLEKRKCCGSCCRHCPYTPKHQGTAVLDAEQMLKILQKKVKLLLKDIHPPHIAAFDADGTLWSTDMGDEFLKTFAKTKGYEHVFDTYLKMRWGGKKREALIYACQVVEGMKPTEVDTFCEGLFERELKASVFPFMRDLVRWLLDSGVEIYIVTASPSWAVVPGARYLGVAANHVLGLHTSVENGVYTAKLASHYTSGEGKASAFKQTCPHHAPLLTAGNTPDDLHLLNLSQGIKLAIKSAPENSRLYATENELADMASDASWFRIDINLLVNNR